MRHDDRYLCLRKATTSSVANAGCNRHGLLTATLNINTLTWQRRGQEAQKRVGI